MKKIITTVLLALTLCGCSTANAENAKLREEFDKMDVWHSKELTAAMDENAKLRKLARLMWKPFCWAQSGYEVCLTDEQEAEIRDMARELGVEVE